MDIKILKDMFLTIERGNLWKRQDQTIYRVFRLSRTLSGLCGPKNFIY